MKEYHSEKSTSSIVNCVPLLAAELKTKKKQEIKAISASEWVGGDFCFCTERVLRYGIWHINSRYLSRIYSQAYLIKKLPIFSHVPLMLAVFRSRWGKQVSIIVNLFMLPLFALNLEDDFNFLSALNAQEDFITFAPSIQSSLAPS